MIMLSTKLFLSLVLDTAFFSVEIFPEKYGADFKLCFAFFEFLGRNVAGMQLV